MINILKDVIKSWGFIQEYHRNNCRNLLLTAGNNTVNPRKLNSHTPLKHYKQ